MAEDKHWLLRPQTIRLLWWTGLATLALTVLADLFYEPHPYFEFDGWFAFNAGFGLAACVAMIFFAKFLGVFLKRDDNYYDGED